MAVGGKMCGLHWVSKGRNVEQETSQTEPESPILSYFGQNHYELLIKFTCGLVLFEYEKIEKSSNAAF